MLNATSLTILVALTDIGWGVGILYSIYKGSCLADPFWFIFAVFLILVGLIAPIYTLSPSRDYILDKYFTDLPTLLIYNKNKMSVQDKERYR